MPEPKSYQILTNLRDALLDIAEVDGYYYDVDSAAVKLDADTGIEALLGPDGPQPRVILEPYPEVRQYTKARRIDITWLIDVHWAMQVIERDDETRLQRFYRGCADVEKAVTQDLTRGGQAIDTLVIDCTNLTKGAMVWAVTKVQIRTTRIYGLP